MKKKLILFTFILSNILFYGQEFETDWSYDIPVDNEFKYQYFKKEQILLIADKNDSLVIFDTNDRNVISKIKIENVYDKGSFRNVNNHPFIWIDGLPPQQKISKKLYSIATKTLAKRKSLLINYLTGETLLNTQNYPTAIEDTLFVNYDVGSAFSTEKIGKMMKKKRVFTYGNFGEDKFSWQIPEPAGLKRISLRDDIWQKPLVNKDYLVLGYADNLYGIERNTGKILWEELNANRRNRKLHQQSDFLRLNDSLFYMFKDWNSLSGFAMKNGKQSWEKAIELKPFKSKYLFIDKGILVANEYNTNLYSYANGLPLWENDLVSRNAIEKIQYFSNNLLFSFKNYSQLELNILKENQFLWEEAIELSVNSLYILLPITKGHFFLGDTLMGLLNEKGDVVYSTNFDLPDNRYLWTYSIINQCIFYISKNTLLKLDFLTKTVENLGQLPKVKGEKEDSFNRIWSVGNKVVIASQRNLLIYNTEGNLEQNIYHRSPGLSSGAKRTLIGLASFAIGAALKDEMADIYNTAYQEGLISNDDLFLDISAVGMYGYSGGMGSITAKYTDRIVNISKVSKDANQFKQNWIIEDKDKEVNKEKPFGLRIINVSDLSKSTFIPVSKKRNFDFEIDPNLGGIFYFTDNTLHFKSLISNK